MSSTVYNLSKNVKVKDWYWNLIPWIGFSTATAIYPNIYIPPAVYQNLISKTPNLYHQSRILHEQTHIDRQQTIGLFKWGLKYLINREFRYKEEILAISSAIEYIKSKGLTWDIQSTAKSLSGWLYFWMIPQSKAISDLKNIWEGIKNP